jgi:hypothetical protein
LDFELHIARLHADFLARPPTPLSEGWQGASCFFLRFDERTVAITADHVVEAHHTASAQTPTIVCEVRLAEFDLDAALIDRDLRLDLATFAVSEA